MTEISERQARQCTAFLRALRVTGNVTIAAGADGVCVTRKTLDQWRRRFPDFGSEWDAAIVFAEAMLAKRGPQRPEADGKAAITRGGEYTVRGSRGRKIQVRRAKPGLLTPAGERIFLSHLSATANLKLSAEATGIGIAAIYARRRTSPAFEREVRAALEIGYERVELALLDAAIRSVQPDGERIEDWIEVSDEPPLVTPMSAKEAMLVLAQGQTRLGLNGRQDGRVKPARSSREDAEKRLLRDLDAIERRMARDSRRR